MPPKWSIAIWLIALLSRSAAAQSFPREWVASYDMPDREFAPGVLIFNADPNSRPQYQRIYTKSGPTSFHVDESCRPWLLIPTQAWTAGAIGVLPLEPGAWTCVVQVLRFDQPIGTLRVYLNVGPQARGGLTAGVAAPTSLTFLKHTGVEPPSQSITVNADAYYATLIPIDDHWNLGGEPARIGAAPGLITVSSPTTIGLEQPQKPQQLYIETASGVEVVRLSFAETYSPVTRVEPGTINRSYRAGGALPTASLTVDLTGGSGSLVSVGSSAPWVRVSPPARQVTPATYGLDFDPLSLPNGLNTASLVVRVAGAYNSQVTVPVVLRVSGSSVVPGSLSIDPSSLEFSMVTGGASTATRSVSVSAPTPMSYTVSAAVQSGLAPWLRVSPAAGLTTTANPTFGVSVDTTGLPPGNYAGTVTVAAVGTPFSRVIPVNLFLAPSTPVLPPTIGASPAGLSFVHVEGSAAPPAASLQITGTPSLTFTAKASSAGGWLSVTPTSGTIGAGTTLTVSVNPAALTLGPYTGSILLEAANAQPVSAAVSLTVSAPRPTMSKVCNAASYSAGPIAPGEIVTVFGDNLGPAEGASLTLTSDGKVATTAGGVELTIGGYPAPILYAGKTQISAVVPYEIASPFLAYPSVVVRYRGTASIGFPATQELSAPGIFTADSSGQGPGAILNADSAPNGPDRPAARGEIVQLYLTGEGQTSPPGVTGQITTVSPTPPLTPQPFQPVAVTIDGHPATIHFYGEGPGVVAGLMQVNVEIPAAAGSGEVPIVVTLGAGASERSTQAGVTVSVR